MKRRFDLGRVFGIPLHVDASWFIVLFLVSWTLTTRHFPLQVPGLPLWIYGLMGVGAAILLFVCVLLHEFGHSLVAQSYGMQVHQVTLFMFGGVAHIALDPKRPRVELFIALAGPLVSFAIAVTCFSLARVMEALLPVVVSHPGLMPYLVGLVILRYLGAVNLAILVFNLLPGFPLDGGRVLRAILWAGLRDLRKATRIASVFGNALGIGLLVLGSFLIVQGRWTNGIWYVLLGIFLRDAARSAGVEAR